MKPGDLGFTFTKGNLFSILIWKVMIWKTQIIKKPKHKFSHVVVYLGNGLIAEAVGAGVIIVSVSKYSGAKHTIEWQTPVTPLTDKQVSDGFAYVGTQAGITSYSKLQDFLFLLQKLFGLKPWQTKGQVCSEFAVNYYLSIGVSLSPDAAYDTDPLTLYESEALKEL